MTEAPGTPAAWTIQADSPAPVARVGVISPRLEFAVSLTQSVAQGLHIAMSATTAEQAPAVLASCSHVIVDLYIADTVPALTALLQASAAQVVLVIPDDLVPTQQDEVRQIPGVDQCVRASELGSVLAPLQAPVSGSPLPGPATTPAVSAPVPAGGPAVGGWRCVAVWSLEGGIGKTRITRALGLDCVRRGCRTVVMGLGVPDVLPLQAGLHPEPNLSQWQRNPQAAQLAEIVQADGDLDLLAGFLSPLALSRFAAEAMEGEAALSRLTMQTAHLGYAAVLLDISAQEVAVPALQAANTLVLVSSATPQGAVAAVEAYRLVRHEIGLPPASCHLVVNRYRPGHLTPGQFAGTVRSVLKEMPDPVGILPEDDPAAHSRLAAPGTAWGSEEWQAALRDVGTRLFGTEEGPREEQESRFGPLVIKRG